MFLATNPARNTSFVRNSRGILRKVFQLIRAGVYMAVPVFVCETYESTVPHQFVDRLFDNATVGPQLSESPLQLSEPLAYPGSASILCWYFLQQKIEILC